MNVVVVLYACGITYRKQLGIPLTIYQPAFPKLGTEGKNIWKSMNYALIMNLCKTITFIIVIPPFVQGFCAASFSTI